MVDSTQLCLSCNCTHGGCYATVMRSYRVTYWPKKQTMLQDRKKYVFFSAEAFNTHKFHCVFFFEDTNPWKKWDEINIWTNKPYMEFNTLAAFRASSTKCHVNIAQGRNHGRNLVFPAFFYQDEDCYVHKHYLGRDYSAGSRPQAMPEKMLEKVRVNNSTYTPEI